MILVTGCCGFIGSHTCVELLNNNYQVVGIDNLCNSKIEILDRIKDITNREVKYYFGDILNYNILNKIFKENKIDCVIHFAGLKAVGESIKEPLRYYDNNISGTINLLKAMTNNNIKNISFSSSATVYGLQDKQPISEDTKLQEPVNPYGKTKLYIENILKDLYKSDNS